MSDFVNTVDLVGDEALTDSIIDRSLAEIRDDQIGSIGSHAFYACSALTSVDFPVATSIGAAAFYECSALTSVDLPVATSIGGSAFYACSKLETLILRSGTLATGAGSMFTNTKIENGTGYIYVPAALLDSYKTATNWSKYANRFRALEDYTVDGTTTGALDASKI